MRVSVCALFIYTLVLSRNLSDSIDGQADTLLVLVFLFYLLTIRII